MTLRLSPAVQKRYLQWVESETWYRDHDLDRARFYRFVRAHLQYSRKSISIENLRVDIVERHRGKFNQVVLEQEAMRYAILFSDLVDFSRFAKH